MVSAETIRQDTYAAIRALLVANKPAYTYEGDTQTYDIVAEYGRENPAFPVIVLNKAMISTMLLCLDGSGTDYLINVQLDFFAKELHGKKAIDAGIDSVQSMILTNMPTLKDTYGLLLQQEPFDESNNAVFEDRSQVLNTASLIIRMKLQ